jgi:hypothetical protein
MRLPTALDGSYAIVVEANGVIRHIQLKVSFLVPLRGSRSETLFSRDGQWMRRLHAVRRRDAKFAPLRLLRRGAPGEPLLNLTGMRHVPAHKGTRMA